MDSFYSNSLLIAILAAGGCLVLVLTMHLRPASISWLKSIFVVLLSLAVVSLVASILVHWGWGHSPESLEPMGLREFVEAHPAFWVTAFLIAVALAARSQFARKEKRGQSTISE